ncbi:MAG: hypothetical protein IKM33_01670 [Clostridia bacterium]|nr:hypothetical protein [Clostridia bacterium]
MNFKKLISLFLAVLMLCGAFGSFSVITAFAEDTTDESTGEEGEVLIEDYLTTIYASPADKLATMKLKTTKGNYAIYADEKSGEVAVKDLSTGQILFSNPYDVGASTASDSVKYQLLSQIIVKFSENGRDREFSSYEYAAMRDQIKIKNIKNGIRVEYTIGREEARRLVPRMITAERFETMILAPMEEYYGVSYEDAEKFKEILGHPLQSASFYLCKQIAYFHYKDLELCTSDQLKESMLSSFPIVEKFPIYVLDPTAKIVEIEKIEEVIKTACPNYSYEELDYDHMLTEYTSDDENPPVFKMALEYTIDEDGFTVRLPANGIRFNESKFQLTNVSVLPYMGAGNNAYDGYTFYPDGSGALFAFEDLVDQNTYSVSSKVYGTDYAYHKLTGTYQQAVRYPVFGIVENTRYYDCVTFDDTLGDVTTTVNGVIYDNVMKDQKEGNTSSAIYKAYGSLVTSAEITERVESHGFVAIIEEGDALTELVNYHAGVLAPYDTVQMNFNPRPKDSYNVADAISVGTSSEWTVVSDRKYVGNYKIHYVMLGDENLAAKNELKDGTWYKATWLGMAMAYRDYLEKRGILSPLAETNADIPLYIEAFGALEVIEKIASIPVEVMKPLTSTQDVITMYEELSGKGATNINFKLTGYANGGMYATVPGNLKWEKAVTRDLSMQELLDYAAGVENGNLGIYPDFDFAYISSDTMTDGFSMRKHSIRTIDDRMTYKRDWIPTQQRYGGMMQMVVSPAYYEKFYTKFMEKYLEQSNLTGISVGTMGTALNSDFDEDEPYNREDAKSFTTKALAYISGKDETALQVMVSGGNAFTWQYADHILGAALDSSRYIKASYSVPFVGVVLHGYSSFTGTPLNMEGDVNYAKLKAIENGASVYFTLSYQNTQNLKEDDYLSQYYSVRYDIWFDDVVEIYNQLNTELKDVQNKVIMDHQFLSGMRVPDVDELDRDLTSEFNSVLDFQNNKAEYEAKQQAAAVADARDKIASVETAAQNFVRDCIEYYSGTSGAALLYVTGNQSFERRLAEYNEAKEAYDIIKAEYDAADEAGKQALSEALVNAQATEDQAWRNFKSAVRKIGRAIASIETEYAALTQLLEDAKAGKLLITSTEGCPQSIINEIELQLANTAKHLESALGVKFLYTVDKAEVDTFLYTHLSTLMLSCYGETGRAGVGVIGKAENLYKMLIAEDYGLLMSEIDLLRYLPENQTKTDEQLIADYGLREDKSSVDGLVKYVKELLGNSYEFDPIIAGMEGGIEDNIRDYFVSILYGQISKLSANSLVPALNFVPNRVNENDRLVSNTANINRVTAEINQAIDKALLGETGVIANVQNGDYTLSGIFTEDAMSGLIDEIVEIIRKNTRTMTNTTIAADQAIEYATPDTMASDIRDYIEGYYYRAVINKIAPEDAGSVNLQVITVSTKTNASIELLLTLRMDEYEYGESTKYEDLVKAMMSDGELKNLLSDINDSVKVHYGDVYTQLENAFLKAFATKVLGKDSAPTLQKVSIDVVDGETKTKRNLRDEAKELLNQLSAFSTEAEINALIDEMIALHADYAEKLPEGYDATADVTKYVYYNLLVKMSGITLKDIDNYYYDDQMAKMDATVRAEVAEKVAAIRATLPEDCTVYDVYATVAAVLGDREENVYDFIGSVAAEVTHTAEGKYSLDDEILAYYCYLLFSSFEDYDINSVSPTLSLKRTEKDNDATYANRVKNALKILDLDFVDRLPLLVAQAKSATKRGLMPDYSLESFLSEEELETIGNELVDALIKALFAKEDERETLLPEVLDYLRLCYYKEIVKRLSAGELPEFHVSEIYSGTLYEATTDLKDLMYYFAINNTDLTAKDIDEIIKTGGGLIDSEEEEDETSRYLSDDGRIVSVTYGTKNADGSYSAYKTFILNYNNFSVNVEYSDVTYTIPAYGYVVVMH